MLLQQMQTSVSIFAKRTLVWTCFLTLLGYAWKHIFWTQNYLHKIYTESFVSFIYRLLGLKWKGFTNNQFELNRPYIYVMFFIGIIFLLTSLWVIIKDNKSKIEFLLKQLVICSFFFILVGVLSSFFKSKLSLNEPFEYALRLAVPLLFLKLFNVHQLTNRQVKIIKLLIAVTFISHGLYALNLFPTPSNFMLMTSNILSLNSKNSILFLTIIGVLDVLVSLLLFIKKTEKQALYYIIIWGFLTTLARLVGNFGNLPFNDFVILWIPEFLTRCCHFLIPYYLLLNLKTLTAFKN